MVMRKPAATKATQDQSKRDKREPIKETLKDLATEAQIKGGASKAADPDDGGE